jgi:hypothetical protein
MQLAGELSKINLASLVQLIHNGELTGKICLTQGAFTAFIFVENGRIIHVETDTSSGAEAFLDLFLWTSGSFSFIECDVSEIRKTLSVGASFEKLIRQGIEYLRKKQYLDEHKVNSRSILKSRVLASTNSGNPILNKLNGFSPLENILSELQLSKKDAVEYIHEIISSEQAEVINSDDMTNQVILPDWVIARLKQDNANISEAIVQMVIWADLMKCWMYKAESDLGHIVEQLEK